MVGSLEGDGGGEGVMAEVIGYFTYGLAVFGWLFVVLEIVGN